MRSTPSGHVAVPPAFLAGARVRLRPWVGDDRTPFAALNADPKVMEHFPATLTRAQSDALVDRISTSITERGWGLWAAEYRPAGTHAPQFIGFVGLNSPTADLPFNPCVEIGWRLAQPYWGHGLAQEAARLALRIGFDVLQLDEIVAFTSLNNARSRAVMHRLGMEESPGEQFDHPSVPADSPVRRHRLYRLPQKDWGKTTRDNTAPTA